MKPTRYCQFLGSRTADRLRFGDSPDERFAKGLQTELAESVASRPRSVTASLFEGRTLVGAEGREVVVDDDLAHAIYFGLVKGDYITAKGTLTDGYYAAKASGTLAFAPEVKEFEDSIVRILDSVYDERAFVPENARTDNVVANVDAAKLEMKEFKELWGRINAKSVYTVDFDTAELVRKSIDSIDRNLRVTKILFKVEEGRLDEIASKDALLAGTAFGKGRRASYDAARTIRAGDRVKYDLVGKLVAETGLTRRTIVDILRGIEPAVFGQFKDNPEEFILKAAGLINDEKATAIVQHITYNVLDERYDTQVFTEPTLKGRLGVNAMKTAHHLYDHVLYDSANERQFATELDADANVAVYVKLPHGFYITTPVGRYNPDWAIAFRQGPLKHIYFVAETKGSMNSLELREIERSKIHCAREHFKAISGANVVYDVVDGYQALLDKVMR